jgi:hypothetical protein
MLALIVVAWGGFVLLNLYFAQHSWDAGKSAFNSTLCNGAATQRDAPMTLLCCQDACHTSQELAIGYFETTYFAYRVMVYYIVVTLKDLCYDYRLITWPQQAQERLWLKAFVNQRGWFFISRYQQHFRLNRLMVPMIFVINSCHIVALAVQGPYKIPHEPRPLQTAALLLYPGVLAMFEGIAPEPAKWRHCVICSAVLSPIAVHRHWLCRVDGRGFRRRTGAMYVHPCWCHAV